MARKINWKPEEETIGWKIGEIQPFVLGKTRRAVKLNTEELLYED